MARTTIKELEATIEALREQLDAQYVVSVDGFPGTTPATLREVAQVAYDGHAITVHGKVGRGVYA